MKLHRKLGITRKSTWHLAHRLRAGFASPGGLFTGPVEVDEIYIGGKERNKHASRKLNAGRGQVRRTTKDQLQGFVRGTARTNGTESFWSLFKRGYYAT